MKVGQDVTVDDGGNYISARQMLSKCKSLQFQREKKKKKKVSARRGRLQPGVPERQSFTLTTRPPRTWC